MMKLIISSLIVLSIAGTTFNQGIRFEKSSWTEALRQAKQEGKLLFVDTYTSWCGPCKRMAREVFSREKTGRYFNTFFVNYQVDMEKGIGPELKERYKVEAYPTFLFLDGDGKLIYKFTGYHEVREFIEATDKVWVYVKYGGWDKVQAALKADSTGMDFWADYYEVADKDEKQDVIRQWLRAMPDKALFDVGTGYLVKQVDYDRPLYLRIARGVAQVKRSDVNNYYTYVYPFRLRISDYIKESIVQGDWERFRELLEIKEILLASSEAIAGDVEATEPEAYLEVSPEFLYLCYAYENRDKERFKELLPIYLKKVIAANPLDSLAEKIEQKKVNFQTMVSLGLFKSLIPKTTDCPAGKQDTLPRIDLSQEYHLLADYITKWADYFWRISPSNQETREQCVHWVIYACSMNPYNPEIPIEAASLLARLGQQNLAAAFLKTAIQIQEEYLAPDLKMLNRLKDQWSEIINKKI